METYSAVALSRRHSRESRRAVGSGASFRGTRSVKSLAAMAPEGLRLDMRHTAVQHLTHGTGDRQDQAKDIALAGRKLALVGEHAGAAGATTSQVAVLMSAGWHRAHRAGAGMSIAAKLAIQMPSSFFPRPGGTLFRLISVQTFRRPQRSPSVTFESGLKELSDKDPRHERSFRPRARRMQQDGYNRYGVDGSRRDDTGIGRV